jgi:hypothetical protein
MAWKLKKRILILFRRIKKKIVRFFKLAWAFIKFIARGFRREEIVIIPQTPRGEKPKFEEENYTPRFITPRSGDFKKSADEILNNIDEIVKKGGINIPSHVLARQNSVSKVKASSSLVEVPITPVTEKNNNNDSKETNIAER